MKDQLLQKILDKKSKIGVIGLGYVGLPLALLFAKKGFSVTGFDTDIAKIDKLHRGECYIRHLDGEIVHNVLQSGNFNADSDFTLLSKMDVIIVCVPTPLTAQREPNMSYVTDTANVISENLQRNQLVILESTTYPGTTQELLKESLEKSGLVCSKDFYLAFSPEREDPGNINFNTQNIPKVVGGICSDSQELALTLYKEAIGKTVAVSSASVAEATKLTENIFRAVNISLVNELKIVYDKMGIDIWEVLDAAETKPFGFMRFDPGPGLGGHCIPLAPFYLSWKAREYGIVPKFIELAGEVNTQMPQFVIDKIQYALNKQGTCAKNSKILILGLAYKKDVDDPRESPSFEIINKLLHLGANISYHDPHITKAPKMRSWPGLPQLESVRLSKEVLNEQDLVVIVTAHSNIDYEFIQQESRTVVDSRGVYSKKYNNVIKA